MFAGAKNYRGHWAFVTGVILCTIALAAMGALFDEYTSLRDEGQFGVEVFFIVAFLTFGVLSLWSGHRLHRCMIELEKKKQNA